MDDNLNKYWAEALKLMAKNFNEVAFDTWIKPLEPLHIDDDNTVILRAKDNFYKTTVESRHLREIINSLKAVSNMDIDVKIISPNDSDNRNSRLKSIEDLAYKSNLKSKYIFETFVRGKSNELAYAASLAVAEEPGTNTFNPLFLYGGVGLGKTHLMQAIGNYVLEQNTDSRVLYVTTETFTNELISSIRERKNQEFRNKYRDIDVLLIDDIQFLSDKEGTQEEFFHTFNTLYDANKQIVITSDQPPKEIKTLEDRLRSRFGCGLTVDITLPDFETRMAILEKKVEMEQVSIPSDVLIFIVKNIVSNIRDMEGALNKVLAYSKLTSRKITMELTENALKDHINGKEPKEISIEYIQQIVADYYSLTVDELRSRKRTQNITYPRQIAMYLSRKILNVSLPKIGEVFGGRDHSTVIHSCEKIADEVEKDFNLRNVLIDLEHRITG